MALTEPEKQLLVRRVAEIEARTGAEIVTSLVAKCDHYPEIPWKAFALGASAAALVVTALTVANTGWAPGSPLPIIILILGAGLAPALLTLFWPAFARLFLGRERAAGEVLQHAESLFLKEQLFQTRSRTGILLLVARFERQVVIVPDRAVRERIAPEAFDGVIARMTPLLAGGRKNCSCVFRTSAIHGGRRKNCSCVFRTSAIHGGRRTAQAFEAGLAALEELLHARGFSGAAGPNELPDRLDEERPT